MANEAEAKLRTMVAGFSSGGTADRSRPIESARLRSGPGDCQHARVSHVDRQTMV